MAFVAAFLLASTVTAQTDYTVLPGDTYARVARSYDLTLSELRSANPGRGEALAPGDVIRIPQPMKLVRVLRASDDGRALEHTVEAGQTLYAIAQMHGVQVEELQAWNPQASTGLSIGDVLVVGVEDAVKDALVLTQQLDAMGVPSDLSHSLPQLREDTLRALLMLPFMLEADTITGGVYSPKTRRLREVALEFMHGAQWAAQALSDSGYTVSLRVVDTEPDSLGVHLWTDEDLAWADVVLGPLRKEHLDSVNNMLRNSVIPQWVLTPQSAAVWEKHSLAFSMEPEPVPGMRTLGALAAAQHDGDTVMMLETRGPDAVLERAFREGFAMAASDSTVLQSVAANSRFAEGLIAELDTSKLNPIAIPAGKSAQSLYAYVQTELQLADSFPVHVYANAESKSFEFLERRYLERSHYTVPVSAETRWNDARVTGQIEACRMMFETDPSLYALVAFDALIESAHWQGLPWPLPALTHYRLDWQWNEERRRFVNEHWSLSIFEAGAWKPVPVRPVP